MTTPLNEQELAAFTAFERKVQRQLDLFYHSQGYLVLRKGTKTYDLILDGVKVEEKIRSEIRDDILLEISQDIVTGAPGWFSTTEAEKLNYIMCENKLAVLLYEIYWPGFKKWFIDHYLHKYWKGSYIASFRGWGVTINIPVKIYLIPELLILEKDIIEQGELAIPF